MLSLIFFPLIIFCVFNLIFIQRFTRATGLSIVPTQLILYVLAGAVLTLAVYLLLLLLDTILGNTMLGSWYESFKVFSSPILEDLLKISLLSFLCSKVHVSPEQRYMHRQQILAGILLGLSFGLFETYLQSFVLSEFGSALLGSIPLQMVIGGAFGAILSRPLPSRRILRFLIILGHLIYNQMLQLPGPLAVISLIVLTLASFILIHLLGAQGNSRESENG
ncbi:MAG: hypothetical protein ACR2PY_09535 [Salinispira sp.]